jgi:hypothetical protein
VPDKRQKSDIEQVYRGSFYPLRAMRDCGLVNRVRGTAAFFQLLAFASWHFAIRSKSQSRTSDTDLRPDCIHKGGVDYGSISFCVLFCKLLHSKLQVDICSLITLGSNERSGHSEGTYRRRTAYAQISEHSALARVRHMGKGNIVLVSASAIELT